MAKETAAQRRTRIGMLLADYDARAKELNKLTTIVKGLKEQVKALDTGRYGEWEYAHGTAREIPDMAAVRADFAARGVPLPTKFTDPPIVINHHVK